MSAFVLKRIENVTERVHAAAGRDGLAAITKQQALGFGAPRLAMLGGWGAPGTPLVDDDHVTFVNSFGEALASPEGRVNLQAFHREAQAADAPPPLPALLDWPLPDVLFGDAAGANASRAPLATRVDMATRVSQAGAVTWWHLDDGGEVTLQVALPVDVAARANARPLAEPVVRDASQLDNPVVVKVRRPFSTHALCLREPRGAKAGTDCPRTTHRLRCSSSSRGKLTRWCLTTSSATRAVAGRR